jgi:hypothetical protein
MTDIVERLRRMADSEQIESDVLREAADTIERLNIQLGGIRAVLSVVYRL